MLNSNEVLNGSFGRSRGFSTTHNGIDLLSPTGTVVKSRWSGKVKATGDTPGIGFGKYIRVGFNNKIDGWYGHLSVINVTVGQVVAQGQPIGVSGATGQVTGPHLHYSESKSEATNLLDYSKLFDPDRTGGVTMVSADHIQAYARVLVGRNLNADEVKLFSTNDDWNAFVQIFETQESKDYRASLGTSEDSKKLAQIKQIVG